MDKEFQELIKLYEGPSEEMGLLRTAVEGHNRQYYGPDEKVSEVLRERERRALVASFLSWIYSHTKLTVIEKADYVVVVNKVINMYKALVIYREPRENDVLVEWLVWTERNPQSYYRPKISLSGSIVSLVEEKYGVPGVDLARRAMWVKETAPLWFHWIVSTEMPMRPAEGLYDEL